MTVNVSLENLTQLQESAHARKSAVFVLLAVKVCVTSIILKSRILLYAIQLYCYSYFIVCYIHFHVGKVLDILKQLLYLKNKVDP